MEEQEPEYLRKPDTICIPDRRTGYDFDLRDDEIARKALESHHAAIDRLKINKGVPKDIVIQFETTKNIYLYAWFVYRFYPVSAQHALSVLELALRERLEPEIPKGKPYRNRYGELSLSKMLMYCNDNQILKDENFSITEHLALIRARERRMFEIIEEMNEEGLEEVSWDESDITITDEDRQFDHVGTLTEFLPKIRNDLAHGSIFLTNNVYHILRDVSEIINQLWGNAPVISGVRSNLSNTYQQ